MSPKMYLVVPSRLRSVLFRFLGAALLISRLPVLAGPPPVSSDNPAESVRPPTVQWQTGIASYYGTKYHGKPTASGELFDMNQQTAAHPTLPFGTMVRVTNLANRRSVVVRINDRGPFVAGRSIDVSLAAARILRMTEAGLARVRLEILPPPTRVTRSSKAGRTPIPA
jgi:rare lipoprotein A